MTALVVAIFVLTYVLIAARRFRLLPIGRPAGALLGATLMVVSGAMSPAQSYRAIDGDTIVLLLAMMILTAELELTGFFGWAGRRVLVVARTPRALLVTVAVVAALGSAFLVNDTICLFMTPIVVETCLITRQPLGPYLIVLATSANLGSAATLVGNPQNMLIGSMSGMQFGTFIAVVLPVVVVVFALHLGLALVFYRKRLPRGVFQLEHPAPPPPPSSSSTPSPLAGSPLPLASPLPPPRAEPHRPGPREAAPPGVAVVAVVFLGVVAAFFAGAHLGYAAMAGAVLVMVVRFRDPVLTFAKVDWTLLLFFCGLFIVTGALRETGLVEAVWREVAPALRFDTAGGLAAFTGTMTLGSNVVSNVPMVVLTGPYLHELGDPQIGWTLLAYITTIAGNLTLVGSVANLIVAEGAREHYHLGFFEYLRFGALSTVLSLAVGVPLISLWGPVALSLVS